MPRKNGKDGRVRITVSDFGPIASADIELRPLTILVGPSNTGKSCFATLVYALSQLVREGSWTLERPVLRQPERPQKSPWLRMPHNDAWARLSKKKKDAFAAWVRDSVAAAGDKTRPPAPLPDTLRKAVRSAHEMRWQSDSSIEPCIKQLFGLDDLRSLTRVRSRKFPRIGVSIEGGQGSAEARLDVSLVPGGASAALAVSPGTDLADAGRLPPESRERWRDGLGAGNNEGTLDEESLKAAFGKVCLAGSSPLPQLARRAHYLPADRTGIMHAHRVVAEALLDRSAHGGMREQHTRLLPGVVGDFLQELADMPGNKGPFHSLGKDIETGILDGDLHVEKAPGACFPDFLFHPRGWAKRERIPLLNASAAVSELAPLALSLRNTVRKGDLLIIEEPEAHLPPGKQTELAFHLARLVRCGVRVIVITHSPWMIDKFSNLIATSKLTTAQKAHVERWNAHIEGANLGHDQVGAWLFSPRTRPKGSVVSEVPIDLDTSAFGYDFMGVNRQLYDEWGRISRRLSGKVA